MDKIDAGLGGDIFKQIVAAGDNWRGYRERGRRWSRFVGGPGDIFFDRDGSQRQNQNKHDDRNEWPALLLELFIKM